MIELTYDKKPLFKNKAGELCQPIFRMWWTNEQEKKEVDHMLELFLRLTKTRPVYE